MSELAHSRHQRFPGLPRLLTAGTAGTAIIASLISGWLVGTGHASATLVGCLVALAVLTLVVKWNPGVAVGFLVLVVMNGIPGVDIEQYLLRGGFRLSDGAVFVLAGGLAVRVHARGGSSGLWGRRLSVWGLALGAWWLVVLGRTYLLDGVPVMQAFLFGRDFLYFAILVPLLAMALRGRRELVGCLGTLAVGAILFSVGELGISAAGASSSGLATWFVHGTSATQSPGVTRVFATMGDALAPLMAFGLGLAVMPPKKRFARRTGVALVVLAAFAAVYTLTRALYIGTAIALIVTTILWLRAGESASTARRGLAVLFAILLILVVSVNYRSLTSPFGAASTRISSAATEFEQRTGNIGYRYNLDQQMFRVLGSNWIEGLGFLHPASHPVAGLPSGSIRNSDVGVMNSLMTMGAVGTTLLYLAPISILLAVTRRLRAFSDQERRDNAQWFFYGATMWLIVVLVSSISLVTLFSPTGLALSATLLACAAGFLDDVRAQSG